ncbi:hypothetical protein Q3G72_029054 [Acer saccharum]|nr:hypothetical protein Q3G72_029054 [Acer saccharum]
MGKMGATYEIAPCYAESKIHNKLKTHNTTAKALLKPLAWTCKTTKRIFHTLALFWNSTASRSLSSQLRSRRSIKEEVAFCC